MNKPEIDKEQHYGRYQKMEDRRSNLGMKVAHKALDIPEDDMNIKVKHTGIGAVGAVGIALAAAALPTALAAYLAFKQPAVNPAAPVNVKSGLNIKLIQAQEPQP